MSLSLQSQTAVATLGSGTIDNPYQISSLENLFWLCAPNDVLPVPDESTRWSKYYVQTTNIDASSSAKWNEGKGFYPIAHESYDVYPSTPFTGSYDGNGFNISGIYINENILRYTGFFG